MKLFRSILVLMLFVSAVPTTVLGWLLASTSRDRLVTATVGTTLSLLLAVALSAWFARSITRPVASCVRGALDIARGRFGKEIPGLRPLAEALVAGGYRVLLWDRPNCGASWLQEDRRQRPPPRQMPEPTRPATV